MLKVVNNIISVLFIVIGATARWGGSLMDIIGLSDMWETKISPMIVKVGLDNAAGAFLVIGVTILIFSWAYSKRNNRVKNFQTTVDAGIERMPLIELRKEAEKKGWTLDTQDSYEPIDFIHGLKQAGHDGAIQFYGRKRDTDFDDLTKNNLLEKINSKYWVDHEIDISELLKNDNFYVRSYYFTIPEISDIYMDLHVEKVPAMSWLDNKAGAYRGRYERSQNGKG